MRAQFNPFLVYGRSQCLGLCSGKMTLLFFREPALKSGRQSVLESVPTLFVFWPE